MIVLFGWCRGRSWFDAGSAKLSAVDCCVHDDMSLSDHASRSIIVVVSFEHGFSMRARGCECLSRCVVF